MKTRFDETMEKETTPSRELIRLYREALGQEDEYDPRYDSIGVVQYRGTAVEYELGLGYIASPDPLDRQAGADLLGQLGWGDRMFLEESVDALIPLLEDSEQQVAYAAGIALGHRGDPRAIPALIAASSHDHWNVRYGVVSGLSGHDHPDAIAALIRLTKDEHELVRDWAVFGLGSQIEVDTPEIREALAAALDDADEVVRGEALVGLANRRDSRVVAALLNEWEGGEVSQLSLEAAAELGDPMLVDRLEELRDTLNFENYSIRSAFDRLVEACRQERDFSRDAGPAPPSR